MKKIKIFFVASEESLGEDKLAISNFIRYLNEIYRPYKLYFELIDEVEGDLEKGELFYILFENELSEEAREAFEQAYAQFKEKANPKIVTYLKQSDNPGTSVLDFMKRLGDELGHYYSGYQNVDTIKLNMIMQLESLGLKEIKLEPKDGKLYLNDKELIGLENISLFKNNQELADLKSELSKLEDSYWKLREQVKDHPDDDILDEYTEVRTKRKKVMEQIASLEVDIISMESSFVKMSSEGPLSKRQIYARKCLEEGDLAAAKEALSIEEIEEEVKLDLKVHEKSKEALQIHVNEFIQRADTLKLDHTNPNRFLEIEESYEKAIELEKEAGLDRKTLFIYAAYLLLQNKNKKALEIGEAYYYYLKSEKREIESYVYRLLAIINTNLSHFEEAEKYYLEALKVAEVSGDEYLPSHYFGLAVFYKDSNRYEKALETALLMVNRLEESELPVAKDLMDGYKILAYIYAGQSEYQKAINYSNKALDIFYKFDMEEEEKLEYSCQLHNNLATIYSIIGKLEMALEGLLLVVSNLKKLVEINTEKYESRLAKVYFNLGKVYGEMGDYEKECCYLHQGVEIFELLLKDEIELNSRSLCNGYRYLGLCYINLNQLEEGEKYTLKSYELATNLYEENKDVYASLLAYACCNLGLCYYEEGKNEEALNYSLKGRELLISIFTDNPGVNLNFLINNSVYLLELYKRAGDFTNVERIGKETDKVIKDNIDLVNGKNLESVIAYYNSMLAAAKDMGRINEADKYAQKIIEFVDKLVENNSHQINLLAQVYFNVGYVFFKMEKIEEALKYQKLAKEKIGILFVKDPERYFGLLAEIYSELFACYKALGMNKESFEIFESFILLLEDLMKKDKALWQFQYYNNCLSLVQFYIGADMIDDAFKILLRIEKDLSLAYKNDKEKFYKLYFGYLLNYATVTIRLGLLKNDQGDYEEAVQCFLKAIECNEIYVQEYPNRNELLVISYIRLASSYRLMKQYNEALIYALKAIAIREKIYKEDNSIKEDLVNDYYEIIHIYLCSNPKGASVFIKKILELYDEDDSSEKSSIYKVLIALYDDVIDKAGEKTQVSKELSEQKIKLLEEFEKWREKLHEGD